MALREIEGRLTLAKEGRDLQWRLFYQEDVVALQAQLQQAQAERGVEQQGRQGAERQRDAARREREQLRCEFDDMTKQAERAIEMGQRVTVEWDMAIGRAEAAEATLRTIRDSAKETPSNYEEAMKLVWRLQNAALAVLDKALEGGE